MITKNNQVMALIGSTELDDFNEFIKITCDSLLDLITKIEEGAIQSDGGFSQRTFNRVGQRLIAVQDYIPFIAQKSSNNPIERQLVNETLQDLCRDINDLYAKAKRHFK